MLEIKELNVFYGQLQVLWDVSLTVEEGEVVSIVGPNAAGKTTLLNTISGLIRVNSGSISFVDNRIDGLSPVDIVKLGVTQVPEGRRLFSTMSVLDNLLIGAYIDEARKRKNKSLERVFELFPILKERKNQLAETLSGGEQQMLATGRALMAYPKLLMLDEPSLGLAPKLVLKMFDAVSEIRHEGITILLVEQNVYHSLELADRGYVLENGRIIATGRGKALLETEHIKKAYLGV